MVKRFFSIVGTGNQTEVNLMKTQFERKGSQKYGDQNVYHEVAWLWCYSLFMISRSESKSTGDIKFW